MASVFFETLGGGLGATSTLWGHAVYASNAAVAFTTQLVVWALVLVAFQGSQAAYAHYAALGELLKTKRITLRRPAIGGRPATLADSVFGDVSAGSGIDLASAVHAAALRPSGEGLPATETLFRFYFGRIGAFAYDVCLVAFAGTAFVFKIRNVTRVGAGVIAAGSNGPSTVMHAAYTAVALPLANALGVSTADALLLAAAALVSVTLVVPAPLWTRIHVFLEGALVAGHALLVAFLVVHAIGGGTAPIEATPPPRASLSGSAWLALDVFPHAVFPHDTIPTLFVVFGVAQGAAGQRAIITFLVGYMIAVGLLGSTPGVLPVGATNRMIVDSFVDTGSWMAPAWIPVAVGVTLLPLVHLIASGRGAVMNIAAAVARVVGVEHPAADRTMGTIVVGLLMAVAAAPRAPIDPILMVAGAVMQVLFVALAFRLYHGVGSKSAPLRLPTAGGELPASVFPRFAANKYVLVATGVCWGVIAIGYL